MNYDKSLTILLIEINENSKYVYNFKLPIDETRESGWAIV